MFKTALTFISIAVILYVAHIFLQKYTSTTFSWNKPSAPAPPEQRVAFAPPPAPAPVAMAPPPPVAPPPPPPPAPAAPSQALRLPEQQVEASPSNPFQEMNSPTPVQSNLRRPENSFGPGPDNTGTQISLDAGISSKSVQGGANQFSPEFAQNGGEFMSGILASDGFGGDNFATI